MISAARRGAAWATAMVAAIPLALSFATAAPLRAADPAPAGDARTLTRHAFEEPHMGGLFRIAFYADDPAAANRAARAAFDRVAALEKALSDYDSESELMRLCRASGDGNPIEVSDDLFRCLEKSLETSAATDGLVDATVGPLTQLWRRSKRQRKLPEPEKLAAAKEVVGWKLVTLDRDRRTVALARPGMRLDLGAIAKGYAADEALLTLRAAGFPRAMVDAVGNVAAGDPPPDAPGWKIGVVPLDAHAAPSEFLYLTRRGVATSGDAWQWVEIDGVRYSHIVDPRTGLGQTVHASATVVAEDGMTADRLGSAVLLLGPERGLALIDKTPGAAALVVRVEAGETKTYRSSRWEALDRPPATPE